MKGAALTVGLRRGTESRPRVKAWLAISKGMMTGAGSRVREETGEEKGRRRVGERVQRLSMEVLKSKHVKVDVASEVAVQACLSQGCTERKAKRTR